MNKISSFSKFGLVSAVTFLFFSFIGRFLFPFGDEPDFTVRATRVLDGEYSWWSPYYILNTFLQNLEVVSECKIEAGPMSIWASIDPLTCTESLEQILIRLALTMFVVMPVLYAIVFRRSFVALMLIMNFKLRHEEWNKRLDALSLAIIFPSVLYYLGVLAEEQLTLLISLLLILFWGSKVLVSCVLTLVMLVDFGNSIIVLTFIVFLVGFSFIEKKLGIKLLLLTSLGLVVFAYTIGFSFLTYLEGISFLANKAAAMYDKALTGGFIEKYPVILRPVITFMTGVFMLPSGVKVIPLYIMVSCFVFLLLHKLRHSYVSLQLIQPLLQLKLDGVRRGIVFLSTVISTVLFFVFLFPDYGNAKYYVFMIPFIFHSMLYVYSKKTVFTVVILSNIVVFAQLFLFHL